MKELLHGLGFEPVQSRPPLSARQTAILARFVAEEKYVHRVTGVIVDVHHALTGNPWRMATYFEDLWRNRQNVRIGQRGVVQSGKRGPGPVSRRSRSDARLGALEMDRRSAGV